MNSAPGTFGTLSAASRSENVHPLLRRPLRSQHVLADVASPNSYSRTSPLTGEGREHWNSREVVDMREQTMNRELVDLLIGRQGVTRPDGQLATTLENAWHAMHAMGEVNVRARVSLVTFLYA